MTGKQRALVTDWRVTTEGLERFADYVALSTTVDGVKEHLRIRKALAVLYRYNHQMDPYQETVPK